jgi:hypothetical protein
MTPLPSWHDIRARLGAEPEGTRLRLARHLCPHPLDGGLRRGLDLPVGQRADFRLDGARPLCVQDLGSHYEAWLEPAAASAPAPAAAAPVPGAAAGALVALLLAGTREAVLVGALLGAALARGRRP